MNRPRKKRESPRRVLGVFTRRVNLSFVFQFTRFEYCFLLYTSLTEQKLKSKVERT